MGNIKNTAIEAYRIRCLDRSLITKKSLKCAIREIADDDENFENIVFELGCSVLAKSISKESRKGTIRKIGDAYVYSAMFEM